MKEGEEVGGEETREVGGIQRGGEAGGNIKLYRAGEGQGYVPTCFSWNTPHQTKTGKGRRWVEGFCFYET